MNGTQFTSAFARAARTLALASLVAFAACTSVTPTQRPPSDVAALEQRARAAVDAGNFAAAADLFGVVQVLLVVAGLVGGLGVAGLVHRRASELARWERIQTGHRQGPESLPG